MDCAAGGRLSVDEMSSGQQCLSDDSIMELRSYGQVENGTPSTSPPYWDTDEEEEDGGPKPSALCGKFTWKIEKFSQINKRELRSNAFEVGGYKWYILIYPQGCDVCNHLSLFLCVANHDKLLPGWSHFAQFTIAVVNKDPKKSKYSDTLHRFCKKEHDWGWKKFIEISKVLDGFINDDSLVIKAQVQVIREKAHRPFRCLDCQYRRELVRVYLSNVEQICRRYIEDKKGKLSNLIEDKVAWSSFRAFWLGMDEMSRWRLSRDRTDTVLKLVVKHFFVEKEVTSTLVMDSLFSGLKALECSKNKKGKMKLVEGEKISAPIIYSEDENFVLADDVLLLIERVALGPVPLQPSVPKDDKGLQNRTKDGGSGEEFNKDTIERDERRLTEFGRRTLEFYVLAHIFSARIDAAYKESVALKIQEELIREEEAAEQAGHEIKVKRNTADKEKRAKKKQAKQKRNNRRVKDRAKVEMSDIIVRGKQREQIPSDESLLEEFPSKQEPAVIEQFCSAGNASDTSDTGDDVAESIQTDLEERDCNPANWDLNALEIHSNMEAGIFATRNGQTEKKTCSVVDDSSSTCSTDSIPSLVMNGSYKRNSLHSSRSPGRGKNQRGRDTRDTQNRPSDASHLGGATVSCRTLRPETETHVSLTVKRRYEHPLVEKFAQDSSQEEGVVPQKELNVKDQVDLVQPSISRTVDNSGNATAATTTTRSSTVTVDPHLSNQAPSTVSACQVARPPQVLSSKPEAEKHPTPKKPSATTTPPATSISRPSSAPLIPTPRPAVPITTPVQPAPLLSRSMSAAGRLGTDPSPSAPPFVPQSYRNAITGRNDMAPIPSNFCYPSLNPSTQAFIPSTRPGLMFGSMDRFLPQGTTPDEFPHLDIINDLLDEDKNVAHPEENLHYYRPHHHQNRHVVNPFSSRSHFDGGFQSHDIYSSSSRDARYSQVDHTPYVNGQFHGVFDQNQWPYHITDLSMLSLGNSADVSGYSYPHPDYPNGYMYTRPGNGHQ